MPWKHKTYRCEWQVQYGEVDQYGLNFKPYATVAFPTRDEALKDREKTCYQNPWNKEWEPPNCPHAYCRAEVTYVEVET